MEEDIKILEEFIKYFEAEAISRKYRRNISITVGEDDIQAIENLIKGYRELEKHNINLSEQLQMAKGGMIIANLDAVGDFIPKSKIKEKIEEINKSHGYSPVNKIFIEQVLQELLEEK